ncbi:MAG: single-stranded-DNA-specific exonuclease RecJ [Clostridia bacterium]|jgi:single-stranded-DNA-specific exonuclease|nr:single-stranded-DNA-specific exonuclease RecJ [Clostridia bacterium]MBQ4366138.1 single-stranded-DNA-specific exonuclease RecJ [Clostridia bacterium]MBQ6092258.1 single-stranded-DNA-specific exonuclease RecJ [Clostridia bacterium]
MHRKLWHVASVNKETAAAIADAHGLDPFAALLLSSRGITEDAQIEAFMREDAPLCDPFSIRDMDKAAREIHRALDAGERIAVFGDYDADGVTASSLLYLFLEALGADVLCYIPDRNSEGYGLNKRAVARLRDDGVRLIVTVDNGISALEEADYIYQCGMRLVVTDHHRVGAVLPRAEAVVDPHRPDCPSPFKDWAGVGVAFKLCCALSEGEDEAILDDFADLITVGTIADVVPLTGENRTIVKYGLRKLNTGGNHGLAALRQAAMAAPRALTAGSVAFSIVPRLNAVGRIDRADEAFELLISDNDETARQLAQKISDCNGVRQSLEQSIMQEAEKQLLRQPELRFDRVLVFSGEGWHGGVIGIVAARLSERFGKPCIVITCDGDEAKGSGRSLEGFSLYDAIDSVRDLLTHFGGHPLAAGFGIATKDIPAFRERINQYARQVEMPYPALQLDCRLRPGFISADLLPVISMLEPFGAGNPQPLFGLFSLTLQSVQPIGGGKHVRLQLQRGSDHLQALQFGVPAERFPYVPGDVLDLAVRLEPNEYMGMRRVSIYIRSIRLSGTDDRLVLDAARTYERVRRGDGVTPETVRRCLPDRAFAAQVYRCVRDHILSQDDVDLLCYRLGGDGSEAGRVLLTLDVLRELGVVAEDENGCLAVNGERKVDLEQSVLLQQVRQMAQ